MSYLQFVDQITSDELLEAELFLEMLIVREQCNQADTAPPAKSDRPQRGAYRRTVMREYPGMFN